MQHDTKVCFCYHPEVIIAMTIFQKRNIPHIQQHFANNYK